MNLLFLWIQLKGGEILGYCASICCRVPCAQVIARRIKLLALQWEEWTWGDCHCCNPVVLYEYCYTVPVHRRKRKKKSLYSYFSFMFSFQSLFPFCMTSRKLKGKSGLYWPPIPSCSAGGKKHFANFWIFHQIFHRFTLNFANMPFQVQKAWNVVYKNMKTPNPSRCSLALHLKWQYFQI